MPSPIRHHLARTVTALMGATSLVALLPGAARAQGAAAATAAPSVQIYGTLVPMGDHVSVSGAGSSAPAVRPSMLTAGAYNGAGNGGQWRMQSSTANIGFRGSEPLGGGLTVFFQLEHGLAVDTGSVTGPPNSNRFWNRNTALGLRGAFGSLFAGIWDTPMAWSHLGFTNGVRNPYAGDSSSVFVTPGFNIAHTAVLDARGNNSSDATFNRRQGNAIQYWSPNFSGFSFRLMHALAEGEKTAANGAKYSPTVNGLGTEYASGPVLLRYAYQQHNDYFGVAWMGSNSAANPDTTGSTTQSSKDSAHRLIARYTLSPMWQLQGAFDRQTFGADGVAAGGVNRYERDAWSLQVLMRMGVNTLWANVGQAADGDCSRSGGAACISDGLGAHMGSLGWRYDLSRRTDIFASVYEVRNRTSGQYGVFPRTVAGIAPGSTQRGFTAGIEHSF